MDIVDEIKDRISLPDYIGRDVQIVQRSGKNVACCVFHNEQTPSLHIYDDHYHCQPPDTRVLAADLRWKYLGDLSQGEALLAFDENPAGPGYDRRFRPAVVERLGRDRRPCLELELEDGRKILCTEDHRWLVRQGASQAWATTSRLRPGRIVDLASPGVPEDTWLAGYIAGILDGEGSLVMDAKRVMLTITQKPGLVLDTVQEILATWGIRYYLNIDNRGTGHLSIGGKDSVIRLLAKTRPLRLMAKWKPESLGGIKRSFGRREQRVVNMRSVGYQDIVLIETSTATLITDGLASHNCFGCGAHGDIFTYVMKRQNLDFREALRVLAREAGVELRDDAEAQKRREEHLSRVAIFHKVAEFYNKMLTPQAREYLHGRGFRDEFIDSYLLGFAPGDSLNKTAIPTSDLQRWGLVNQDQRDTLYNRVVFPIYGRYDDEIIGFNGRAFPQLDRKPKYMAAPAGQAGLINERGLRGAKAVYLAEGDSDTATLVQAGLPVVGVRGTQGLKDEYKPLFDKCETVYVCADADEPGLALMHSAGRLLGNRARIVMLPDGEDVNSWVGQKGNDIVALAEKAPAYVDWLISRLPPEVAADQVEKHVKEFIPALKGLGKAAQDVYSKKLARALGVTVAPIREELREAIAANGNGHSKDALRDTGIIWQDKPLINPVQELHNGVMYTVVFLDKATVNDEGKREVRPTPYVVSSKREVFELTAENMDARGLRFPATKVPSFSVIGNHWSTSDYPHSVKAYIDGQVTVSPWEVYLEVVGYFRKYAYYPNPLYYDFLALWTIGTYWFELFNSYPYVHLNGGKGSGKTLTMEIIAELAFNCIFSSSLSSAAAFRTIESCSSTVLMDEAENLQKPGAKSKQEDKGDDKLEILKSGYKKGARVIRCTGDKNEPTGFDCYSPKMFGSIHGIDNILSDRAISLILLRKLADLKLPDFEVSRLAPQLHQTRDKLHVLMLDYGREIGERLADGVGLDWTGVAGRNRELWTPILIIACFFDDAYEEEVGTQNVDNSQLLTTKMRQLAADTVAEKQAKDRMDSSEVAIVEGCLEYIREHAPVEAGSDLYAGRALFEWLKGQDDLSWLESPRQVYRALEQSTAITRAKDMARKVLKDTTIKARCVRLNKKRLEQVILHLRGAVQDEA